MQILKGKDKFVKNIILCAKLCNKHHFISYALKTYGIDA